MFDVASCSPDGAGRGQAVGDRASSIQLQPQPGLTAASSLVPITQPAPTGAPLRVDVSKHVNAALQTTRVELHSRPFYHTVIYNELNCVLSERAACSLYYPCLRERLDLTAFAARRIAIFHTAGVGLDRSTEMAVKCHLLKFQETWYDG